MERAEAEAILDGDRETALALLMRVDELIEANRRLESRVADLEQRLKRSSRNSSLPPSADPPSAPPRPRQAASGRRPGAQPGHAASNRPLLALEQVDEVVDHWPQRCSSCARPFQEEERIEAAAPQRPQVCELPPIAVWVSEHRLHRLRCPACAAETRAELPAGVSPGAFGPRLQAAVATLAVRNRVSRRDTTELLRELFGARLSAGSVAAILQRVALALEEPYEDLLGHVRAAPAVNVDEDRLAPARRQAHASGGRSPFAPRSSASPRVATAARLRRCSARSSPASPARTAGGPTTISTRSDASSAGPTWCATSPPTARDSAPRSSSARPGFGSRSGCSPPGESSAGTLTASACLSGSARSRRSFGRCSRRRRARRLATAATAASRRTCSKAGRRCGASPACPVSSRPTITPSAACAGRSSTASSRWVASPRRASAPSNDCSPPRSPAACSAARSSPTSATCSPPGSAATPSRCLPDSAGDRLNGYRLIERVDYNHLSWLHRRSW